MIVAMLLISSILVGEVKQLVEDARVPRRRTLRQFAEQEIIIPNGPKQRQRWRDRYQPWSGLFFDEVDTGYWRRFAATGPVQSGKTLNCLVIPLLWKLFELRQPCVFGVYDDLMVGDKWNEDILPVLKKTQYESLCPSQGSGSRGGSTKSISFNNGVPLRFFTFGGSDKSVSAFTAQNAFLTEVDAANKAKKSSLEANRTDQIEARTEAYGDTAQAWRECSVSIVSGIIWQDYWKGSRSRIVCQCPHCGEYITPERKDLVGWQDARDVMEAGENAFFACEKCGEAINESQRIEMNVNSKLVHRGQTIASDGVIHGDRPRTRTLGFRWSAFNNLFKTTANIAEGEWEASQEEDEENAQKRRNQFVWATPSKPKVQDFVALDRNVLYEKVDQVIAKGNVPPEYDLLTMQIDVGMWYLHYSVLAWQKIDNSCLGHVVEYGIRDVYSKKNIPRIAIATALREFRDERIMKGWFWQGHETRLIPTQVWIDGRAFSEAVKDFLRDKETDNKRFRITYGYGSSQEKDRHYNQPTKKGNRVTYIGDGYHFIWHEEDNLDHVHVNADYWKTELHSCLSVPQGAPGSITIFAGSKGEHIKFFRHLLSEKRVVELVPGKGEVTTWVHSGKHNHWLDSTYGACAAADFCGVKVARPKPVESQETETSKDKQLAEQQSKTKTGFETPDGQPYFITER